MNKGTKLLMRRMESHPEEFRDYNDTYVRTTSKWDYIIRCVHIRMERMAIEARGNVRPEDGLPCPTSMPPLPYLSDEEVKAIYDKLVETQGKLFEREVTQVLLSDPDMSDVRDVVATASMGAGYR